MREKLLTVPQVAEQLNVSDSTVRRWADDGKIEYVKLLGGHRRFTQEAVDRALNEMRGNEKAVKPEPDR